MMFKLKRNSDWQDRIKKEKSLVYGLRQKKSDGIYEWFYILIDPVKESAFLCAMKGKEKFTLTDYGSVIASGIGEPTQELKNKIKQEYNADIK